jgi:hypothetical protein
MSAKSSRPSARASQAPTDGNGQQGYQVDIARVIQRYRDLLAQANEGRIIAEAGQEQALEENGALRARIAELEAQIPSADEEQPAA